MATKNAIDTGSPIEVTKGGTGTNTLTSHGILLGSGSGAITTLSEASNGQIPIGSTGNNPVLGSIASTGGTIIVTNGAGTINGEVSPGLATATGFASWSGGAPYFNDTSIGAFTLSQAGTGYINGKLITWTAPQTITGLAQGTTNYIYIDSTGTIRKTSTRTDSLYANNIVLFECLHDSTPPLTIQTTVKENHPYTFPVASSNYLHEVVGSVIRNTNNGANISLVGTQGIGISGADVLEDHGLETIIPDSGGIAVTWNKYYTSGSGSWYQQNSNNAFTGYYNNGGTLTPLGGASFGVYTLYASKDNLNTSTPVYYAVLNTAQFNNLAQANNAISTGVTAKATSELMQLELVQLGSIIYRKSIDTIVSVIISKSTLRQTLSTGGTNQASLVNAVVTNFNNVLSSANTNVQSSLDTLDDFGSAAGNQTVNLYTGTGVKTVTLGSNDSTSTTTIQSGSGALNVTATGGALTVNSGVGAISMSNDASATTVNLATGGAIKTVTLGSTFGASTTTVRSGTGPLNVASSNGDLTITSGTGTLRVGTDNTSSAIYIGAGGGEKTMLVGSTDSASQITIQSGIGNITLSTANGGILLSSGTGNIWVSNDASNTSVLVGTGAGVKATTLGSATTSSSTTINTGTGTASIASNATDHTTTVGSVTGVSATTLQSGSGALNVTATGGALTVNSGTGALSISNDASATTVNLATGGAAKTVTLGSTTTTSSLALKYGTSDFSLASATGNVMVAQDTGEINYPLQSGFLAYLSVTQTDVTGDNTLYTIICDTERYDQNSDYNNATGIFTAPVTGKYLFSTTITLLNLDVTHTGSDNFFVTTTGSPRGLNINPYAAVAPGSVLVLTNTIQINLTAGDTATTTITVYSGTKTVDISSGNNYTRFSGHLMF